MKTEIWKADRIREQLKTGSMGLRMCVREKVNGKDETKLLSVRTAKALHGKYVVEINKTEITVVLTPPLPKK